MNRSLMRYALIAGMMPMMDMYSLEPERKRAVKPEDAEMRRKIKEYDRIKRLKAKGLKEFNIDGHVVYAINEKNAIRKVKNLKQ